MDRVGTTITAILTRKTTTQQVGEGTLLISLTTRYRSYSHPDVKESTIGNWPVLQSAVPPVVKVRQCNLCFSFLSYRLLVQKESKLEFVHAHAGPNLNICSVCFLGFRHSIFHCVHRLNHVQVSDTLCDSSSRPTPQEEPCNLQPCPALWETTLLCSHTCAHFWILMV